MSTHAVVLVKPILDPEIPATRFRIDPSTRRPPSDLGAETMGPFEQSALELALQLKDAGAVERVTALAVGAASAREALRKALALRADAATLVYVEDDLDPAQTAELIVRAMERLDTADFVLAGRQAGDWDHGQVGFIVAERLGRRCVSLAFGAEASDDELLVRRQGEAAAETIAIRPPAVLTVTNHESNRLRMARVPDLLAAERKPITEWSPAELGLEGAALADARRIEVLDVWTPIRERHCEIISWEASAEAAAALMDRLAGSKLLWSAPP